MTRRLRLLPAMLVLLGLGPLPPRLEAAPAPTPAVWDQVPLWRSDVLSAYVHFRPVASLADESFLYVEFENHTPGELRVGQAFVNLDGDRNDPVSGETRRSGGVTGGVLYTGRLGPGRTTVGGMVCLAASEGLGLPPRDGYRVELSLRCDTRLDDGRAFLTPEGGAKFRVDWKYPGAAEMQALGPRLRTLLATTNALPEYAGRLQALLKIPELADTLTVDDLLTALESGPVGARQALLAEVARRFTTDPKVVAYFGERITRLEGDRRDVFVLADFGNSQLWNPAWVPALVNDFRKRGDSMTLGVLSWHRDDWVTNRLWTTHLSEALLRHRPLLHRDLATLKTNELYAWCQAVREAGTTGDPTLIPRFVPALDDLRVARHPQEARLAYLPVRDRLCDAALLTILTLLDGSPLAAMKEAGADNGVWPSDLEARTPLFDRARGRLKERLAKPGAAPAN